MKEKEKDEILKEYDPNNFIFNKEITNKNIQQNDILKITPKITLSRKIRWAIFIYLVSLQILVDIDQGILSSTTSSLIIDFKMTERELGGFGSMKFLGNGLGCISSFTLINKFNRKYLLISAISFDLLCLFLTTKTTNLILLYLFRVIVGLNMAFISIYVPVWADQFGIHKYKSMMITIIHISSVLGTLFGYIMGILMGWKLSFYLQNILIIIHIIIIIYFFPGSYFSMILMPLKAKLDLMNSMEEKNKNEIKDKNINLNINENEEEKKLFISNETIEDDDVSLFEDIQTQGRDIRKKSILNNLKVLSKSKIYILINITLSCIYIIISATQFWMNDYMEKSLSIEDDKKRLYLFVILVVTSPPIGIILGGYLTSKVGGYDTEKAIYIPLFSSLIVFIFANIAPLTDKIYIFYPAFWIFFCFGSVLIPVITGIILVSVDKEYSGSANSISTFLYNIFGRLVGPNLYAFYQSIIKDKKSRIPLWLLLNTSLPGFICIFICVKYQKEKYSGIRKSTNKNKELEEILDNFNSEGNENKNKHEFINK